MKIQKIMLIAAVLLCTACNAETRAACSETPLDFYLGTYTVQSADRYRGGLTDENTAQARIGNEVLITKEILNTGLVTVENPQYAIKCYPATSKEGEIPRQRWSVHYGLGIDRKFIEVLEVYAAGEEDDHPSYYFEIVDSGLWELFDGWVYSLQRTQ